MKIYKLGDIGLDIIQIEQDLVKAGYGPDGHKDDMNPATFDEGMRERVVEFQKMHHDELGRPLEIDGKVGLLTQWALKNQNVSRILTPPRPIEISPSEIPILMKVVRLPFYADKKIHTFWLDVTVADSFIEGINKWQESGGGQYVVTGTYRSVAAQAAAKIAKPSLCSAPGWSMHAHGRAVDGHVIDETGLILMAFYEHMQKFGWYTIFNYPGTEVRFQMRESWHIQNTGNAILKTLPGIKSHVYLEHWAGVNGGAAALIKVVKKETY